MKMKRGKGLSPVVATVLLIAMVVIIGLIVFLWFRGMTEETITKFDGTNVKLVCGDVKFDARYSSGTLYISNLGNVPIFEFQVKISQPGSHVTKGIKELTSSWEETGLNQGGTFSGSLDVDSSATEITLIPVLMGTSEKGKKTYVCDENQYGEVLEI